MGELGLYKARTEVRFLYLLPIFEVFIMKYGTLFTTYFNRYLISIENLDKLPTHRLLAYFKKNRGLRYSGICPCCGERYPEDKEEKQYYDDCELYVQQIKELLNTREHVERKKR